MKFGGLSHFLCMYHPVCTAHDEEVPVHYIYISNNTNTLTADKCDDDPRRPETARDVRNLGSSHQDHSHEIRLQMTSSIQHKALIYCTPPPLNDSGSRFTRCRAGARDQLAVTSATQRDTRYIQDCAPHDSSMPSSHAFLAPCTSPPYRNPSLPPQSNTNCPTSGHS